MNDLRLVDTSEEVSVQEVSPEETSLRYSEDLYNIYWREKYDRLREDTCAQTIRSLRSELTTIKRLCVDGGDADEVLRSVLFHARLALEVSK